jgi:AraC family transcriptional regulator
VYDPTVLALTCLMRDEVARGAVTGRLYAESLTIALLSRVVEQLPQPVLDVRGSLTEPQQRRLRQYILDNLGEDLSLVDLARLTGRSPRQFSTLFKQAFGTTPHRYLLLARLAEGARQLAQRDASVADIAHRLGFSSQSHFASAFRAVYGETPRSYATGKRSFDTR